MHGAQLMFAAHLQPEAVAGVNDRFARPLATLRCLTVRKSVGGIRHEYRSAAADARCGAFGLVTVASVAKTLPMCVGDTATPCSSSRAPGKSAPSKSAPGIKPAAAEVNLAAAPAPLAAPAPTGLSAAVPNSTSNATDTLVTAAPVATATHTSAADAAAPAAASIASHTAAVAAASSNSIATSAHSPVTPASTFSSTSAPSANDLSHALRSQMLESTLTAQAAPEPAVTQAGRVAKVLADLEAALRAKLAATQAALKAELAGCKEAAARCATTARLLRDVLAWLVAEEVLPAVLCFCTVAVVTFQLVLLSCCNRDCPKLLRFVPV